MQSIILTSKGAACQRFLCGIGEPPATKSDYSAKKRSATATKTAVHGKNSPQYGRFPPSPGRLAALPIRKPARKDYDHTRNCCRTRKELPAPPRHKTRLLACSASSLQHRSDNKVNRYRSTEGKPGTNQRQEEGACRTQLNPSAGEIAHTQQRKREIRNSLPNR